MVTGLSRRARIRVAEVEEHVGSWEPQPLPVARDIRGRGDVHVGYFRATGLDQFAHVKLLCQFKSFKYHGSFVNNSLKFEKFV